MLFISTIMVVITIVLVISIFCRVTISITIINRYHSRWLSGQDDWLLVLCPGIETSPADGDYSIPVETKLETLSVRPGPHERAVLGKLCLFAG